MFPNLNVAEQYPEKGNVIDSKIRKFFFKVHDKEVERDLRVTVRIIFDEISDDQKVVIELTNDSNPILLFTLLITKSDFDILRDNQGINVDFKDFPRAMVTLLDKCERGVSSSGGTFKLFLEDYNGTVSGGRLLDMTKFKIKILEECAFKNMCHLTLDVVRGSDLQIQQKLENELCKLKQSLLQESKQHDEALDKISTLVEEINDKNKELEYLTTVISDMRIQREEELKKERQQAEYKEKTFQDEFERKMCQEQDQFKKKLLESQTKVQFLEEEIRMINDKLEKMTSQVLDREKEIEVTKEKLLTACQDIELLRNQNSKLDLDYHDKEKAVNILRTRLAVAEQELKDNNILLMNHQKKLDEGSNEKIELQKNLDFIKSKLEKKESVVLNLSEELLKGNEIISKQQSKISVLTGKLKEYEGIIFEKEELIAEKETTVVKNKEIISNMQAELDEVNKQLLTLNDKISFVENDLKEKNYKLESATKVIAIMKENLQNRNTVLKSDASRSSLLFYRAFLSTPSLLPSDNNRRMSELKDPVHESYGTDVCSYPQYYDISSTKPVEVQNIVEPYVERYLKRYASIPVSIFKSSDIPITVLSSPDGTAVSKATRERHILKSAYGKPYSNNEERTLQNINEYLPFTLPGPSFPVSIASNSHLLSSERVGDIPRQLGVSCSTERCDSGDMIKNFCEEKTNCNSQYAPVVAFRMRPTVYHNPVSKCAQVGSISANTSKPTDNAYLKKSSLRKTPAISAPPLTREQRREVKVSAPKFQCPLVLKSQGQKSSKVVTTKKDPINLHLSNSTVNTGINIPLKKDPYQSRSVTQVVSNSDRFHTSSLPKKTFEEPEPSAYFVG